MGVAGLTNFIGMLYLKQMTLGRNPVGPSENFKLSKLKFSAGLAGTRRRHYRVFSSKSLDARKWETALFLFVHFIPNLILDTPFFNNR